MAKPAFREVEALIARIKHVEKTLNWQEKPNNSRFLISNAQLLDNEKRTIEGCVFEAIYRKPFKLISEKYTFTVFLIRESIKYRIFQLEIEDWDRITHRDRLAGTVLRGPHYHIGDQNHWEEAKVVPVSSSKKHYIFADWLLEYCKKGNVKLKTNLERPAIQGQFNLE